MHVTTIRGRRYENYLTGKFNVRNICELRYTQLTLFIAFTSMPKGEADHFNNGWMVLTIFNDKFPSPGVLALDP